MMITINFKQKTFCITADDLDSNSFISHHELCKRSKEKGEPIMSFTAIVERMQTYYSQLPTDAFKKTLSTVGKSFLSSFAVSFLICNKNAATYRTALTFSHPLLVGAFAAIASLSHAMCCVAFKVAFRDREVKWYREVIKYCMTLGTVQLVISQIPVLKTYLFALHLFNLIPVNLLKSLLDVPAICLDWLGSLVENERAGDVYRHLYDYLGLNIKDSSNSVYLVIN
jgi:hypothetical protein